MLEPKTKEYLDEMAKTGELYNYISYLEEVVQDYEHLKDVIKRLSEFIKSLY